MKIINIGFLNKGYIFRERTYLWVGYGVYLRRRVTVGLGIYNWLINYPKNKNGNINY